MPRQSSGQDSVLPLQGHVFDPSLENEDLISCLGWLKNEIDFFMVLETDDSLGRFGFF